MRGNRFAKSALIGPSFNPQRATAFSPARSSAMTFDQVPEANVAMCVAQANGAGRGHRAARLPSNKGRLLVQEHKTGR